MRDSQRGKVYAAENVWRHALLTEPNWPEPQYRTVSEVQARVDEILRRAYIQKRYGNRIARGVRVTDGRGSRSARAMTDWGGKSISMPVWSRKDSVIIHELCHHFAGLHAKHSWQFAAIMLDTVRHLMGKEAALALKAQYKAHRVRYTPPRPKRPMSPEQREACIARLATARAAKAALKAAEGA